MTQYCKLSVLSHVNTRFASNVYFCRCILALTAGVADCVDETKGQNGVYCLQFFNHTCAFTSVIEMETMR